MRIRSTTLTLLMVGLVTAGLTGCGGGSKKSSSRSTAAGVTTATTGGTTSSGTTTAGSPTVGGGAATPGGGNTSSGSSNTGATSGGFQGGTGVFIDATALLPDSTSSDWGADAADLDGDGDIDVAIAVNAAASRILWNDGVLGFRLRTGSFPTTVMNASDVRAVDVDKDGDTDLIFTANFEPVRVFKNNGTGTFTLASEFNTGNDCYTYNAALGDADGDGDEDVFLANAGQATPSKGQNKLFLNDGTGSFAEAPSGSVPVKFDDSLDATFLDVDNDGDRDVFVANFGTPHSLFINDGTGRFLNQSDVWLPAGLTRNGTSIAQGDMDRDGKIDLFVANEGPSINGALPQGERNTLLLQGTGRFVDVTSTAVPADAEATFAVRLVDVNGDGWLDVFVSNLRAVQRLYLNVQGVLVDATANLPAVNNVPYNSSGLTIGDFNGDRAPDVLYVRRGQKPWLFLNTR